MNTFDSLCVLLYFIVVISIGVWAGRKLHVVPAQVLQARKAAGQPVLNYVCRMFLANREMQIALGCASMTATRVGAGYLNSLAEAMFDRGLLWCHAPLACAVSLVLGGLLFATKMHETGSLTLLDPFQKHFGKELVLLFVIPSVCGEMFWTAASLAALGSAVKVIMEMNAEVCIVISSVVILFYTSLGGLYSVIYTDTFQLATLSFGLVLCVPFCMTYETTGDVQADSNDFSLIGVIKNSEMRQVADRFITACLGAIPWQVYMQRVLACPTSQVAQIASYVSAAGCIILACPAIIIGATARKANFTIARYNITHDELDASDRNNVLAFAIRLLTPGPVTVIGFIAVMSAAMSTVDSCTLSAATMVTQNVYHGVFRPSASTDELTFVLRLSIITMGAVSTWMALSVSSIYGLWHLGSDLVYVLLLPQLFCILYIPNEVNSYGSLVGFALGFFLRTAAGEPTMGLPVLVRYPSYNKATGQQFPFRTFSMVTNLASTLIVSKGAEKLFINGYIPMNFDLFHCFDPSRRRSSIVLGHGKISAPSSDGESPVEIVEKDQGTVQGKPIVLAHRGSIDVHASFLPIELKSLADTEPVTLQASKMSVGKAGSQHKVEELPLSSESESAKHPPLESATERERLDSMPVESSRVSQGVLPSEGDGGHSVATMDTKMLTASEVKSKKAKGKGSKKKDKTK